MTIKIENPRTKKVLQLLSVLATPLPPFMQPWEQTAWMEKQEEAFLKLYRTHYDNPRVLKLLTEVNGASRADTGIEPAVWRARGIAVRFMEEVLKDVDKELFAPAGPKTGDANYDAWSEGRQVERSDGLSSEWGRTAVREANKGEELTVNFRGYVEAKK